MSARARILVVDDEVRLAEAVADGLRAEDFDVEVAHDGLTGFSRALERDYAAIVLDILLPGRNGYRVCRDLREEGVTTPILMLTAKDGEYDEAEALDTGADDFLSKPFSFVVLVARLRALMRRGRTPRASTLTVGSLGLEPVTRACSRRGEEISLTAREASLLTVLMDHSDGVVDKRALLEEVWGADFTGDPNIVEVYVGYLRRKIDQPFDIRTLLTVRGVGYRLIPDAPIADAQTSDAETSDVKPTP
ncbi:MAG TPA: response regulator transcription factor [Acidimicrobiia bacterium]|nr:response regulator transcription factor [Acidimicrobiia bacterium]